MDKLQPATDTEEKKQSEAEQGNKEVSFAEDQTFLLSYILCYYLIVYLIVNSFQIGILTVFLEVLVFTFKV